MKIEIDGDTLDDLTRKNLLQSYEGFTLASQTGKKAFPIYSQDPDENLEQMYILKRAFRLVINYYSTFDERIELKDDYL